MSSIEGGAARGADTYAAMYRAVSRLSADERAVLYRILRAELDAAHRDTKPANTTEPAPVMTAAERAAAYRARNRDDSSRPSRSASRDSSRASRDGRDDSSRPSRDASRVFLSDSGSESPSFGADPSRNGTSAARAWLPPDPDTSFPMSAEAAIPDEWREAARIAGLPNVDAAWGKFVANRLGKGAVMTAEAWRTDWLRAWVPTSKTWQLRDAAKERAGPKGAAGRGIVQPAAPASEERWKMGGAE